MFSPVSPTQSSDPSLYFGGVKRRKPTAAQREVEEGAKGTRRKRTAGQIAAVSLLAAGTIGGLASAGFGLNKAITAYSMQSQADRDEASCGDSFSPACAKASDESAAAGKQDEDTPYWLLGGGGVAAIGATTLVITEYRRRARELERSWQPEDVNQP